MKAELRKFGAKCWYQRGAGPEFRGHSAPAGGEGGGGGAGRSGQAQLSSEYSRPSLIQKKWDILLGHYTHLYYSNWEFLLLAF